MLKTQKARLEKSVMVNGRTSSGMADERRVLLQTRSVIRSAQTGVDVFRTLYVRTANLYVIRCWTISAAGAVTAWHGIASRPGAQSELHCVLNSLQFLDGAGRRAMEHSVAVVDPGQDQAIHANVCANSVDRGFLM